MCELWDTIEKNNLKIIGVLQREEKEGWQKASLKKKIMAIHLPSMERVSHICICEANRSSQNFNPK